MHKKPILSCLVVLMSIVAPHMILGAIYTVDAVGSGSSGWTVQCTFEFDGANYVNWNIVSDDGQHLG